MPPGQGDPVKAALALKDVLALLPPRGSPPALDLTRYSDKQLSDLEALHAIGRGAEPAVEREAELSRIAELEAEIEGLKREMAEARERESVAARNASAAPGPNNPGHGEALSRTAQYATGRARPWSRNLPRLARARSPC
jgi:hypothetical protein